MIYKCDKCNKTFIQKINYIRHVKRKKSCVTELLSMKCDKCNKPFSNKYNLRRHILNFCDNAVIVDNITPDKVQDKINLCMCIHCKKKFKTVSLLARHIKFKCKPNVKYNNIYEFDKKTLGKHFFPKCKNAGEIYIVQNNFEQNNYFKIGITRNLSSRIASYRCGNVYEPRLHYYFPCKDIKTIDNIIKKALSKFHVKREIYKGDVDEIKDIISETVKKYSSKKSHVFEPTIKIDDIIKNKEMNQDIVKNVNNEQVSKITNGVIYTCNKCNKTFNHKNDYRRHTNRKNPCLKSITDSIVSTNCPKCNKDFINKYTLRRHMIDFCEIKDGSQNGQENEINNEIDVSLQNKKEYKCKQCNKILSRSDSLNRHMSVCKIKDKDQEIISMLNKQDAEHKKLMEKLKMLENKIAINTKNNLVVNSDNQKINILKYGNEDISFITDDIFEDIFDKDFEAITTLIQKIHFSECEPENHNIYTSNIRSTYIIVFTGKQWNIKNRDKIIDDIYKKTMSILSNKFNTLKDKLPDAIVQKFSMFLDSTHKTQISNNIKREIMMLLYNKRHIVKETREKQVDIPEENIPNNIEDFLAND